jgi:glycosyltransferase involved in cell wall biosynthesis
MNAAPFFSVIVCCWNSKAYISAAVDSLLGQTDQDFEIVFVDGGSTDGTLEYIEQLTVNKQLIRDVRGGIALAMNVGIQHARGKVISHLHSDDYYLNSRVLETVRNGFIARPQAKWLFGKFLNDVDGQLQPPSYAQRNYSYANLLRRNLIPHVSTFVRTELFKEYGGFDQGFKLAMDYEFWLRIGATNVPIQLDEPLGAFRRHPDSATTKHALQSFKEDFKARFRYASALLWPELAMRYVVRRMRET